MMGNLIDPDAITARVIAEKLRVNLAHASAPQLKRILTDADGVGATVLKMAGSVVNDFGVCAAFDTVPHLTVAGTSSASAFNGKGQADLRFSDGLIALHAMNPFPHYSVLGLASSGNP